MIYFIDEFCKQNRLPAKQLSPKAKGLLLRYKFPGNVRELKSLMELAVVLSADDVIEAGDINLQNPSVLNAVIEKEKTLKGLLQFTQTLLQGITAMLLWRG